MTLRPNSGIDAMEQQKHKFLSSDALEILKSVCVDDASNILTGGMVNHPMNKLIVQSFITPQCVCKHTGAGLHVFADTRLQGFLGLVGNHVNPNLPAPLQYSMDNGFSNSSTSLDAVASLGLVHEFGLAAVEHFVAF